MRKNLLALSIAAMVGSSAFAAQVFDNTGATAVPGAAAATALRPTTTGVGHILAVPYYTTQGTNKTLLNIVNTDTVNGKAVKLRFRGASNSDDVFDITVYMSPGDMWTADVAAAEDGSGISRLVTNDTSCTLPYKQDIKDLGGKFKTNRVANGDKAQTREGYIEILNSADIPPTLAAASGDGSLTAVTNPLYAAIKHNAGMPSCASAVLDLQEHELNAASATDADGWNLRGYNFPTGGLFANWTVVNVAGFASFSGQATAIRADAASGANGAGNIVWFPQTTAAQPNGAITATTGLSADPLLATTRVASAMYDYPDLSTPYFGGATPDAQSNALTAAFATSSVSNEYLTAPGFSTDWILAQPTRRYHVAVDYAATGSNRRVFRNGTLTTSGTGDNYYDATNTTLNGNVICVTPGGLRGYNREELTKTTFVISPDSNLSLCGEVSVLAFNNTGDSVVAGALTRANLATGTGMAEGWFRIGTPAATGSVIGLPVIGYAAAKVNGANLGGAWTHRTAR
ncbi:MAG: cell surface protein [Proteobacteria bacterium]|nr:cell surface protein [Pseudomonadota bacterium]